MAKLSKDERRKYVEYAFINLLHFVLRELQRALTIAKNTKDKDSAETCRLLLVRLRDLLAACYDDVKA